MLYSRPRDTSPDCWSRLVEGRREMAGPDRVALALELTDVVRGLSGGRGSELKSLEELFTYVISCLDTIEAQYMIVGSFASTYHGVGRSTEDLDIVCELNSEVVEQMARLFSEPDFYFSTHAANRAVESTGMFNVLHIPTGWKIDFIVRKERTFSEREFARRIQGEILGKTVYLSTAEDTILSKLEWAKRSLSERQLRDVAEVMDVQGEALDRPYLEAGIRELRLQEVMNKVRGPW